MATKHCSWGKCNSDSRYSERLPPGTYFIGFPKPRNLREDMTEWQKKQQLIKTEKSKAWLRACGRKDFNPITQIKRTRICSLHFVGNNGPLIPILTH